MKKNVESKKVAVGANAGGLPSVAVGGGPFAEPSDPIGDKRRQHKSHRGSGAIWHDCVECNRLADDATFLAHVRKVMDAAASMTYACSPDGSLRTDNPTLLLRDEVTRRSLNAIKRAKLAGVIAVRGVKECEDGNACVSCREPFETMIELGPVQAPLCRDCMIALDGALTTHFGNGKRSK